MYRFIKRKSRERKWNSKQVGLGWERVIALELVSDCRHETQLGDWK